MSIGASAETLLADLDELTRILHDYLAPHPALGTDARHGRCRPCELIARQVVTSGWIDRHDEIARDEGRLEVASAVHDWAAKNEIAGPPLDWAWLGEIVRWARRETPDADPS
jgi:hypothetical protein